MHTCPEMAEEPNKSEVWDLVENQCILDWEWQIVNQLQSQGFRYRGNAHLSRGSRSAANVQVMRFPSKINVEMADQPNRVSM